MKKIIIYGVVTLALVITSCNNNLDIVNPNQATIEVFWKNSGDAEKGVNAIYSTLHRGSISRWMPMLFFIRADEGYSASPWADLANALDKFIQPNYNFDPVAFTWSENYIGIYRANQVLDNVPSIDMDDALKHRYLAEAKFMRGLFYYHLATLWGNVPLMLHPSTPTDLPSTQDQTQADVYNQIESDLKEAVESLPGVYPNSADLGRATKGAAYALLAKVQMQQKKFTEATQSLEWLVKGDGKNVYDLVANYRDNFLVTSENNKESVFEWQFAENTTEYTDDDIATPQQNYGSSISQFMAPRGIGWSDVQANRWVVNEFMHEKTTTNERDPRLAASFLYDSTDIGGPDATMIYGQTFTQRYGTSNNEVWFRKFLNDGWKNFEGYRSPNNYRYIRYADVLLMYAECLNEAGKTTEAYAYVDRVRSRAQLPALADVKPGMTQTQFLTQLKHERLLELSGEGHRWNDLVRWGDLGPGLAANDPGFSNFIVGKHELLPIPQRDRDINPNLKQNPNW